MSLCGFGCSHCGKCGDNPVARYGLSSIKGKCPSCGAMNGPNDNVCKDCGAVLSSRRTIAPKPNSSMSNPSLLKK